MTRCLFASDLHGRTERYKELYRAIEAERPAAVFLGGDLLPSGLLRLSEAEQSPEDFIRDVIGAGLRLLKGRLGRDYPQVFLILGNDDGRIEEEAFLRLGASGLWHYAHGRSFTLGDHSVYGYSYVPPTPFQWKDWERYDVSRYIPPGCISPEDGWRTVPIPAREARYSTIQNDLEELAGKHDCRRSVFLFHTPPHETNLDRAALDGKFVDHVPLDVHVGSIAVRRFIERHQPLVTLHGHVHESARLTGAWRDRIGNTHMFTAAHDGPELALIHFALENPDAATRELL